jgi:acyl-CoA synthetase (AMP-forming)/AMP-acid ligase II
MGGQRDTGAAAAVQPPSIAFRGARWSSDELAAIAAGWLDFVHASVPPSAELAAMLMSNHPQTVALFFALSSLALPVVIFPADARAWRSSPPLPDGTPVFVAPPLRALAPAAKAAGFLTFILPDPRPAAVPRGSVSFLACPGFVNFTSGSTGLPKPVYITTRSFLLQTAAIIEASGLRPGDPVMASLPLSTHYGLGQALILPAVLGSPLGLVERFDHRSVFRLLRAAPYTYWAATPLMADLLARAPLMGPCPLAPAICHVSAGRLSPRTFQAFAERFGVTLKPNYGQTESGFITVDTAAPEAIRADRVGRPAPGIEVGIGDDPLHPLPPGELGRVWFKSPWYMEGYGFPPRLAPREGRDGWWPTADMGFLDERGYLALAGRADDCFKTGLGHLVNPGMIADAFTSHSGVSDIVVIPVGDPDRALIGVVVEAEGALDPFDLRTAAARELPPWLQPHILTVTARLPRLAGGKADRNACLALLREARGGGAGPDASAPPAA